MALAYRAIKLRAALEAASQALTHASAGWGDALQRGIQAYEKQLTTTMLIAGAAMAPTLNPKAASGTSDAVERLLVRLIPRPAAGKTVFEGDVVAFASPFAASAVGSVEQQQQAATAAPHVLVRRVAALPGDELTTGEEEDAESYVLPEGYCWVLADNEALAPPQVIDSRSFGPLPLSAISGRVLYAARSETDHGPVENSEEGMSADAPVVEAELDVPALCAAADRCGT